MKIKSKILIQKIEKQDYLQDLESIKYSDITNAKLKTIAQKNDSGSNSSQQK